jgi:PilZ domain
MDTTTRVRETQRDVNMLNPRALAVTALACGGAYLLWRLTTLGSGWLLTLSIPLLLTEVWALTQLALLTVQCWRVPPLSPPPAPAPVGTVPRSDVVIIAHQSTPEEVERSLVGTAALVGSGRVTVVDDGDRPEVRDITDRFRASYLVDPEVVSSTAAVVHDHTSSGLYVWLEGGQVPMPGLLLSLIERFDDPKLASCQTAVGLLNADSLVHLRGGRDEEALLRDVIGPGLDRLGSAPWFGPASMVRRSAIEQVDGFDRGDPAAVQRALIRLHQDGWSSGFDARRLVRATAPDTLDDYLSRRRQRALEGFAIFGTPETPVRAHGLSWRHRLVHLANALSFGTGIRQLIQLALLTVVLVSGHLPFDASASGMFSMWASASLVGVMARRALGRGSMALGDWIRHGWRTLGADAGAVWISLGIGRSVREDRAKPATGLAALGHLRMLALAMIALELALVARASTIFDAGLLPSLSSGGRVLVLSVALWTLAPMVDVLQVVVLRRQRRRHHRLRCALPITIGTARSETVDLAPTGVGVLLESAPEVGAETQFTLTLPALDGTDQIVQGTAAVRSADLNPQGTVRVGLEFVNLSDAARLALIAYCAIGHSIRHSDVEPPLAAPSHLQVKRVGIKQRALQAVTSAAVIAGIAFLWIGPASAEGTDLAEPSVGDQVVNVLDTSGEPLGDVTVRYFTDAWYAAGMAGPGTFAIPALDAPTNIEVAWQGSRIVRTFSPDLSVVLARLRADTGVGVTAIDRGTGWGPFEDGMEILPGRFVVRMSDGSLAKLEVPGGHELTVPSGTLTQLEIPIPIPTPAPSPEPAAPDPTAPVAEPTGQATESPAQTATPVVAPTATSLTPTPAPDSAAPTPEATGADEAGTEPSPTEEATP